MPSDHPNHPNNLGSNVLSAGTPRHKHKKNSSKSSKNNSNNNSSNSTSTNNDNAKDSKQAGQADADPLKDSEGISLNLFVCTSVDVQYINMYTWSCAVWLVCVCLGTEEITIHVCDKARRVNKDFVCPRGVLVKGTSQSPLLCFVCCYIYICLYETPILVFNSPDNPDMHSYDNPDNRGLCGRHAVFPGVSDGHSVTGGDRHLRPLRRAHLPVAHDVSHSSSFNIYIHPLFSCLSLCLSLSL